MLMGMQTPAFADGSATPTLQNKGLTWYAPRSDGEADAMALSRSQIFARCVALLGGRAAEEAVFGPPEAPPETRPRDSSCANFVPCFFVPPYSFCAPKHHLVSCRPASPCLTAAPHQGPAAPTTAHHARG